MYYTLRQGIQKGPIVASYPKVVIIETEWAQPMPVTGDNDDAWRRRLQDLSYDEIGEQEVAQVVDGELTFEAIRGESPVGSHHAGIIYQDINPRHIGPCVDRISSCMHGGQRH